MFGREGERKKKPSQTGTSKNCEDLDERDY
jgi:hypothetical protein